MPAQQQITLPKPVAWDQHFPDVEYSAQVRRAQSCTHSMSARCCLSCVLRTPASLEASNLCNQDRRAVLLRRLEAHFAGPGWPALERLTVRHGELGVVVDYAALRGHCADSDLAVAMEMNPADALACTAGAVHEAGLSDYCQTSAPVTRSNNPVVFSGLGLVIVAVVPQSHDATAAMAQSDVLFVS